MGNPPKTRGAAPHIERHGPDANSRRLTSRRLKHQTEMIFLLCSSCLVPVKPKLNPDLII